MASSDPAQPLSLSPSPVPAPAPSPGPSPAPSPAPAPGAWRADALALARLGRAWLARPRVRLSLAGVALLALGALVVGSSVWTLPLVIGGALMVLVAWIGHRLEGRLALQWGPGGAQLDFRATVKPALEAAPEPAPAPAPAVAPVAGPPTADDVIEGEAHTVEIDLAELRALIAAAEAEAAPAPEAAPAAAPAEAAPEEIRISRAEPQGAPTRTPAAD